MLNGFCSILSYGSFSSYRAHTSNEAPRFETARNPLAGSEISFSREYLKRFKPLHIFVDNKAGGSGLIAGRNLLAVVGAKRRRGAESEESRGGPPAGQEAFLPPIMGKGPFAGGGKGRIFPPHLGRRVPGCGFQYFTRAFLLHNWILEKGNSLSSRREFLRELKKFERRLPIAALGDPNTMAQFVFYRSSMYRILKMGYLRYRAFSRRER